jgi:VanZ family protein
MDWHPKQGCVRVLVYKVPALACMPLIFYPTPSHLSPTLNGIPDYLHSLDCSVLCLLVFLALHEGLRWGYLIPILITVLYCISDEFHQSFVPARDSAPVGAPLGSVFIFALRRAISSFRRARGA